jgi:hypothetical protein
MCLTARSIEDLPAVVKIYPNRIWSLECRDGRVEGWNSGRDAMMETDSIPDPSFQSSILPFRIRAFMIGLFLLFKDSSAWVNIVAQTRRSRLQPLR